MIDDCIMETNVNKEGTTTNGERTRATNFVQAIVERDLKQGANDGRVVMRFPPEPNGYPHIGHAKSICLNFGIARDYNGVCHLRFDDTNPETEDIEYVKAFKRDVKWLGFEWDAEYYASDYFEQLYDWAVELIKKGKAYVDSMTGEQIREYRGTVNEPGKESPYRNRSVEENLDLFERMKNGEFGDGEHVLRAKIDMASPNMLMRDPVMYRIRHAHHYRRGDDWCIYPLYDWAHGQSDAIEKITHSVCTLEFEVHRPLYDWFIDNLDIDPRPRQYEFSRLNLEYIMMSKRKLLKLVQEGHVQGWDDPRMSTISGMRRRGITPEAIRTFCDRIGVTRVDSRLDMSIFEHAIRDDLNYRAPRVMCVLKPLKVVLTNVDEGEVEWLDASYWPHDVPNEGSRKVPFSRELYIERDDFMEDPPKRYKRLTPGRSVRLRHSYVITCTKVIKNEEGKVVELRCTVEKDTLKANPADGRKVWGVIHWVSAAHALTAEVRLYDRLFRQADPEEGVEDFRENLNPESLVVLSDCRIEPSIKDDPEGTRYQFERQGYFWPDPEDSSPDALVFNRIVPLRDTWAKLSKTATTKSTKVKEKKSTSKVPKGERRDPVLDFSSEQKGRYDHYATELGLEKDDAVILAVDSALATFFEQALAAHNDTKAVANWVVHELRGALKGTPVAEVPFDGGKFGRLVGLIDDGTLSGRLAKDVFAEMMKTGEDPADIVEAKGLKQVTDTSALEPLVDQLMAEYPDKVELYRGGKTGLLGFFVGQMMRQTQGKANPQVVKALVQSKLE